MSCRYNAVFAPMLERIRAEPGVQALDEAEGEIEAARYTSAARLAAERDLIAHSGLIVGVSSQLESAGDHFTHDASGVPLLVVRDEEGRARVFVNACRHRGTRVVDETQGGCAKSFVCPYHAWTYDLSGALRHIPRSEQFARLPETRRSLREVEAVERHGLIWAQPRAGEDSFELDAQLGEISDELGHFDLDQHVVFAQATREHACDWKLLIEAFLDAYHIQFLHKSSVGRFFGAPRAVCDRVGDHVRSLTARTNVDDAPHDADPRSVSTLSYILFPNTVFIFHPDYVSLVTVYPTRPGHHLFEHKMLVPRAGLAEAHDHYRKSFQLIDEQVFRAEDLGTCERIQAGLNAGVVDSCYFGQLESPALWFHESVQQHLAQRASLSPTTATATL